jgi:hypothetical protein
MTPSEDGLSCYAKEGKFSSIKILLEDEVSYALLLAIFELLLDGRAYQFVLVEELEVVNGNLEGKKYDSIHLRKTENLLLIDPVHVLMRLVLFEDFSDQDRRTYFIQPLSISRSSMVKNFGFE